MRTDIGALIERLGRARATGQLAHTDAVAQLREADPSLSPRGAELQLNAWRGARLRWAATTDHTRIAGPGNARQLRTPIHFPARQEVS